jgi:hypothetical protein
VAGALGGAALIAASFLIDAERYLAGDAGWSGWPLFAAGLALALAAIGTAVRGMIPVTPATEADPRSPPPRSDERLAGSGGTRAEGARR